MKKLLIIVTFFTHATFAQVNRAYTKQDSLKNVADSIKVSVTGKVDSVKSSFDHQLDSIQGSFNNQVDSIKDSYAKAKGKIESAKAVYQQKIDSLNSLKLPTEKYTAKVDSLNSSLAQVQQKVATKIDSLKGKVSSKIRSLESSISKAGLPPQANEKITALTSCLDKVNLPSIDADVSSKLGLGNLNTSLPNIPAGGINTSLPSTGLPNTNLPNTSLPNVNTPDLGVQDQLGKVNDITGQAGNIQTQLKEVATVEGAEKVIESKVAELDQVKAIQQQSGLPTQAPATGDEAKEQLKELAKKEAVNHFAGKEAALQQAMDKMSKYKQKYGSVSSLKDLPKRAPNPLKGKPFIERLVPELALQMFMKDNFRMDFAPYIGYRFTERLTAGAGWNQRTTFKSGQPHTQTNVYGPRLFGEYKIFKGISGRLEIEIMNAFVPQNLTVTDQGQREWVPAILAGMKQEYPIYKNLKGTALVLYNFYNPDYKSPYGDRLNARIGFEYVIKKKTASRQTR